MASSIHIEKVKTASFVHNDRTMKVSYLIASSENNYCSCSSDVAIKKFNNLKYQALLNYKKRTNQRIQNSVNFLKEAIVNLEAHHTEKDLEPIVNKLELYGFTVLQVAIHRDEGFKDDMNKQNFNYHAHITMFNLKEDGTSVKFGKNYRTELSRLQTFTAETLGMERGTCSVEEEAQRLNVRTSKAKRRLGTHEYKQAMKEQEPLKAKQKDLKAKIAELKEELKKSKATRTDYAELEKLKKELEKRIKDKDLTIQELENELISQREIILNQTKDIINLEIEQANTKQVATSNLQKFKQEQTNIKKFISRELNLKIDDTNKGFWYIVKDVIRNLKEKVNSLLSRNEELKNENAELHNELKKDNEVFDRYNKTFDNLENILLTQKEKENKKQLPLEKIVERVKSMKDISVVNGQECIRHKDHHFTNKVNSLPSEVTSTLNKAEVIGTQKQRK